MPRPRLAPYGTWKSPITSDLIVAETIGLGQIVLDGEDIYWTETRPKEAGRCVIVRCAADGVITDVTPAPYNARTRVHEYGGGAFAVAEGIVYFANFADQRLYCQRPGENPMPLTPQAELRYADGVIDQARQQLICVREDHSDTNGEVVNTLVSVGLAGDDAGMVIASGRDFYSSPRLSPDGNQLAWLEWDHPNMPWDGTELCTADCNADGSLGPVRRVAGGPEESIVQPEWSPDGTLHFLSDRSGWWNLYRDVAGRVEPLCPKAAEFGGPAWVFGLSWYAFQTSGVLLCIYSERGQQHLARLDLQNGQLEEVETPHTSFGGLRLSGSRAVYLAGTPTKPSAIATLDLVDGTAKTVRPSSTIDVSNGYLSVPESITFPTANGQSAHAYYYAPRNQDHLAPPNEKPPLLVKSHGGPTAATSMSFNLAVQYWTSRGFAVLDVNYGGSTGYGREYRNRLRGHWGVVDVDDCVNGALFLVEQGLADRNRLAIDGGSAGGYTTLSVLTFRDVFKAGASYYGVSDLASLAADTHKFESRYLDSLIGPYPERRDLYEQRSPIKHVNQLSCPVIFFQGNEDKIVPPSQAESMAAALRARGLPVAYLLFEGEQHGFRQAQNIKRALDAELYFFAQVLGFDTAEEIEPVEIS